VFESPRRAFLDDVMNWLALSKHGDHQREDCGQRRQRPDSRHHVRSLHLVKAVFEPIETGFESRDVALGGDLIGLVAWQVGHQGFGMLGSENVLESRVQRMPGGLDR
jgi:hypothetical protein